MEDTGSFQIPASITTALIEMGLAGWPSVVLARRTVDARSLEPGCVELVIKSEVELPVKVPEITSCTEDTDCPDGGTCQSNMICG